MKLTDKIIKGLPAPERGNRIAYDDGVQGLRRPGHGGRGQGVHPHLLELRPGAALHDRRATLTGRWRRRRAEAKRLKLELRANGSDPLARLEAERSAPTMADLCQRYLEEHASKKRPSSQADDARMIRAFVLPAFGHKKVAEVTFSDCDGLHRKITRRGTKHRANRVIALLSKAFNLSIRWGWRARQSVQGHRAQSRGQAHPLPQRRRARPPDGGSRRLSATSRLQTSSVCCS